MLTTELTEVKTLCNGLTNPQKNYKNKCPSLQDKESEEEEQITIKCKKCDFNLKSRHEVSSHNLMTTGQSLTTSSNVKFVKKYLSTGTTGMSTWRSYTKNLNNIVLGETNLPGDFVRTHTLGAEICFVAANLYIFSCSGFDKNKRRF